MMLCSYPERVSMLISTVRRSYRNSLNCGINCSYDNVFIFEINTWEFSNDATGRRTTMIFESLGIKVIS